MSMQSGPQEPGYAISTVAGLTGLDPHTIRAWERRYGAVSPHRDPRGVRRYDDAAVVRLQLLKAVTNCGGSIGSIVRLPDATLRERLGRLACMAADGAVAPGGRPSTLALFAPGLSSQLGAGRSLGGLQVTVSETDVAGIPREALGRGVLRSSWRISSASAASLCDAALHRYLGAASACVRHELETMLERVCEHEGIRVWRGSSIWRPSGSSAIS